MSSPGGGDGFRIASAFIEVHAESKGLRDEIKAGIDEAVAGQHATVGMRLSADGLRDQVSERVREAEFGQRIRVGTERSGPDPAEVDRRLTGTGQEIRSRVVADSTGLRERVAAILAAAGAGQQIRAAVRAYAEGLREAVTSILAEAGTGQEIRARVAADSTGLREDVSAKVTAAGAGQEVKPKVKADSTGLREEVSAKAAAAGAGQEVKPKVKADSTGLREEVSAKAAEAGAGQEVKPKVKADGTGLREEVKAKVTEAGAGQEIKVKVSAEEAAINKLKGDLSKAGTETGDAFGKLFTMGSMAGVAAFSGALKPVLGAAALGIGSVVQAVEQLSGALGILPAMGGAAAASMAAIKIGIGGMADSLKAYTAVQTQATTGGAAMAVAHLSAIDAMISANQALGNSQQAQQTAISAAAASMAAAIRSVSSAQQTLKNDQRSTAESLVSANQAVVAANQAVAASERGVTSAVQSEENARRSLNDAILAATRALEDLQTRQRDGAISEADAALAVREANHAVDLSKKNGLLTDLEREKIAQAAVDAQNRLIDVQHENARTTQDLTTAQAKGVDGSNQVISANQALVAAQQGIITAQQGVVSANQGVQKANQSLADTIIGNDQKIAASTLALQLARDNVGKQQISNDLALASAQQAVENATRALALAQAQNVVAMQNVNPALTAYNNLLNKLSPSARSVVNELIALRTQWTALKLPIQQALWQGITADIHRLGTNTLPVLSGGLAKVAGGWNDVLHRALAFAASGPFIRDLGGFLDNVGAAVHRLAPGFTAVLDIVRNVMAVGGSLLPGMATSVSAMAERMAKFVQSARDSGKLKDWIQGGLTAVKELAQTVWNILGALHILGVVSGQVTGSGGLLGGLVKVTAEFKNFLERIKESGKLREYMEAGKKVLGEVWSIIRDLVDVVMKLGVGGLGILPILVAIVGAFRWMADNIPGFLPVLSALFLAWKAIQVVMVFVKAIEAIGIVIKLVQAWSAAQSVLGLIMAASPIGLLIIAVTALAVAAYLIITHWDTVKRWLGEFWDWVVGKFHWAVDTVSGILDWFGGLAGRFWSWLNAVNDAVVNRMTAVIGWFVDLPGRILHAIGDLGGYLYNAGWNLILGFWNGIVGIWNKVTDWVKGGLQTLRNLFPFSPAKEGPFSGTGYVDKSGEALTADFAASILGGIPKVVAAAKALADATKTAAKTSLDPVVSKVATGAAALQVPPILPPTLPKMVLPVTLQILTELDSATSLARLRDVLKPVTLPVNIEALVPPIGTTPVISGRTPVPGAPGGTTAGTGTSGAAQTPLPGNAPAAAVPNAGSRVEIGTLVLNVTGNLDPTNPVAWRSAIERIRTEIRTVERSAR